MQGFFLPIDQGRKEMEDPDSLTPYTAETIGSSIYQRIQSAIERDELAEFEPAIAEMMYMAVLPYLGPEAAEEAGIPPMPFPLDPEVTDVERISEAMIALCVEQRYPNVTLPMLLERAGVGELAFATHFDSLEDCFCKIFEAQRDELVVRVAKAYMAEEGWRNQLRAAAYTLLGYFGEDVQRARFTTVEVLYAGERAKLIQDQVIQGFSMMVDLGRREMEDPDSLTPFTAETIGNAIYGRIQEAFERDELEKFETSVPEMMYMAVLPYLGPEAAREELSIPPTPFPSS